MSKFSPIFGNIRDNFVQDEEIDCFDFANYSSISRSSFSSVDLSKNVRFQHFNWIYPATPEELKLFNYICCPKALKAEVIEKHKEIFSCSNVVGFCIRRGDFKTIIETICPTQVRLLSIEQIKDVIADVFKKFCNDVKILIFSDEIDYLKQHLSLSLSLSPGSSNIIFHDCTTPGEDALLLSLCNIVINNGAYYINDRVDSNRTYESTFGQIA